MSRILFLMRVLPNGEASGGDIPILGYQMDALEGYSEPIDLLYLKRTPADKNDETAVGEKYHFDKLFGEDIEPKISFSKVLGWLFQSKSYIYNRFYSQKYSDRLLELVRTGQYDTLLFVTSYMYVNVMFNKKLRTEIAKRKIKCISGIMVLEHRVLSRHFDVNKNQMPFWKRFIIQREQRLLENIENEITKEVCCSFTVGSEECEFLKGQLPEYQKKIKLLEIIPDIEKYENSDFEIEEKNSIYFVGSYSWRPNTDAVMYFVENIFPMILAKNPQVKFYIIGMGAGEDIKALDDGKNIFFIGKVDNVFEEIKKYSVLISPLRVGGGTRLKLLEGIAWGKAIISTSVGAEGVNLHGENPIIIADEPEDFAQKVLDLLSDDNSRLELKNKARKFAQKYYNLDKFRENMLSILNTEEL